MMGISIIKYIYGPHYDFITVIILFYSDLTFSLGTMLHQSSKPKIKKKKRNKQYLKLYFHLIFSKYFI